MSSTKAVAKYADGEWYALLEKYETKCSLKGNRE